VVQKAQNIRQNLLVILVKIGVRLQKLFSEGSEHQAESACDTRQDWCPFAEAFGL
jgi:hypothetical protein